MGGLPSIPVVTPEQAAAWDHHAESAGIPLRALMECAGRGVAALAAARFPELLRHGILVAAGAGNNGGDGWVAARALHVSGVPVWVAASGEATSEWLSRSRNRPAKPVCVRFPPTVPGPMPLSCSMRSWGRSPRRSPRSGDPAPRPPRRAVHSSHRHRRAQRSRSGRWGAARTLRAALTVTFGGYRRGHLLARDEVGDLVVVDIGLPPPDPAWPSLFTEAAAARELPPFAAKAHKGTRGRVVIVGGDEGMLGAARLAARAAFAAGAGLVHLVAPAASAAIAATAEPDLQTSVQPFEAMPSTRTVALLARADAVVIGPGLRSPRLPSGVRHRRDRSDAAGRHADSRRRCPDRICGPGGPAARRALRPARGAHSPRGRVPCLASRSRLDARCGSLGHGYRGCRTARGRDRPEGVPTVVATGTDEVATVAAGNPGLATGGSGDI